MDGKSEAEYSDYYDKFVGWQMITGLSVVITL